MNKRKKRCKPTAIIVFAALLIFMGFFAASFFGNPVSAFLCKRSAEKYIRENYPSYHVVNTRYNFKTGYYHAAVDCSGKLDAKFYIDMDLMGNVRYGSYDYYVKSKHNTYRRLNNEYDELIDSALENSQYNITRSGGCILCRIDEQVEYKDLYNPDDVWLDDKEVQPERQFDYKDLGEKYGRITVWAEEDDVSYKNAAAITMEIKELMDDAGVKFYYLGLYLRQPKGENGYDDIEGIHFSALRYSDIYPESLEERIEAAHIEYKAFFEKFDLQKNQSLKVQSSKKAPLRVLFLFADNGERIVCKICFMACHNVHNYVLNLFFQRKMPWGRYRI